MLIKIDLNNEEPIYLQVVNEIKSGILQGYIEVGKKLPSVRNLANELGINMHTVSKAYNLLKIEGIVNINRRQGVVVRENYAMKDDIKINELARILVRESRIRGKSLDEITKIVMKKYYELGEEK